MDEITGIKLFLLNYLEIMIINYLLKKIRNNEVLNENDVKLFEIVYKD